jgi:hypothetical protein
MPILVGDAQQRQIYLERDSRKQAPALAQRVPQMEAGDLLRPVCRKGARPRFLEPFLVGEEATAPIPSMDTRDRDVLQSGKAASLTATTDDILG